MDIFSIAFFTAVISIPNDEYDCSNEERSSVLYFIDRVASSIFCIIFLTVSTEIAVVLSFSPRGCTSDCADTGCESRRSQRENQIGLLVPFMFLLCGFLSCNRSLTRLCSCSRTGASDVDLGKGQRKEHNVMNRG